jgi:hypothetical protein
VTFRAEFSSSAEPKCETDMAFNSDSVLDFLLSNGVTVVAVTGNDVFTQREERLTRLLSTLFFRFAPHSPPKRKSRDPLLAWASKTLAPVGVTVVNWDASWADGTALYALVSLASPAALDIQQSKQLEPDIREQGALKCCATLRIPVYAEPGDFVPSPRALIIKMQVQEIYNFIADAKQREKAVPRPIKRPKAHLPPAGDTNFSLGIGLGASKVRYGIYSKADPDRAISVSAIIRPAVTSRQCPRASVSWGECSRSLA